MRKAHENGRRTILDGAVQSTRLIAGTFIQILDWSVRVAERLTALGVTALVFWFGSRFVLGRDIKAQETVLEKLSVNWKALLILVIPLFYHTIRTFLEEVREFAGMKREKLSPVGEADPEETRK